MKPYKIVFLLLLAYTIGFIYSNERTESTWKEKMKFALEEREEVHKIMIDVENTVTKKEAYDEFMTVLVKTCLDSGKFKIVHEDSGEEMIFECKLEDEGEFTVAGW